MNVLLLVQNSISMAARAAGNAMFDVLVAENLELDHAPGADHNPPVRLWRGKGVFEKADSRDYPGTVITQDDRTLVLIQCPYRVQNNEFVRVAASQTYRVNGTKDTFVGDTCVLQKLLVRGEPKEIAWDSPALLAGV